MDKTRFERLHLNTIEILPNLIPVQTVYKLGCMDRSRFKRFYRNTIEIPFEFIPVTVVFKLKCMDKARVERLHLKNNWDSIEIQKVLES